MPSRREQALAALRAAAGIDVLIVGGGVHGAGTFRDLALQGVRCVLVERDDFAAGASGASTRMAHGGIRYLETGQFRLVREALLERNRLLRNAPHLVTPIQVAIPTRGLWAGSFAALARLLGWNGRGSTPGLILLLLGLWLYDRLDRRGRLLPRVGFAHGRKARALLPEARPGIDGLGWMWDGRIRHPERLVWELIEDGLVAMPDGIALNHCALASRDGDALIVRDAIGGETFRVRPRIVINAAGAWADKVHRLLGLEPGTVTASQGTHLFLENDALRAALDGRLIYFADARGRMCMLYAIEEQVLLGTTDLPVDDADAAAAGEDEIAYLLDAARSLFPSIAIDAAQIRFTTCGVRSLKKVTGGEIGAASRDYAISQRDLAHDRSFALLTLVGGKWTTFRAAAESLTDAALSRLGRSRVVTTSATPIGGGCDFPVDTAARRRWSQTQSARTGLPVERLSVLFDRYGTRAAAVAAFCAAAPDRPIDGAPGFTEREVRFLVAQEMCATLEDVILRRTTLALGGTIGQDAISGIGRIIEQESGAALPPEAVDAFAAELAARHGVDIRAPVSA